MSAMLIFFTLRNTRRLYVSRATPMTPRSWRSTASRWLNFNLVGGIGIAVQMLVLVVLKTGLHLDYLTATALAVETAVIHNFLWHERFTWADRAGAGFTRLLNSI